MSQTSNKNNDNDSVRLPADTTRKFFAFKFLCSSPLVKQIRSSELHNRIHCELTKFSFILNQQELLSEEIIFIFEVKLILSFF